MAMTSPVSWQEREDREKKREREEEASSRAATPAYTHHHPGKEEKEGPWISSPSFSYLIPHSTVLRLLAPETVSPVLPDFPTHIPTFPSSLLPRKKKVARGGRTGEGEKRGDIDGQPDRQTPGNRTGESVSKHNVG
ncbi:hypothetical protein V498_10039, partial [Pseudogymnoascus sp. VKM F-4517 (FW-2822)]